MNRKYFSGIKINGKYIINGMNMVHKQEVCILYEYGAYVNRKYVHGMKMVHKQEVCNKLYEYGT